MPQLVLAHLDEETLERSFEDQRPNVLDNHGRSEYYLDKQVSVTSFIIE